jgi:hypothetical protein
VIEADGRGDHSIGRREDPAQDGYQVHPVEDDAVADGEAFVLTDIRQTRLL